MYVCTRENGSIVHICHNAQSMDGSVLIYLSQHWTLSLITQDHADQDLADGGAPGRRRSLPPDLSGECARGLE